MDITWVFVYHPGTQITVPLTAAPNGKSLSEPVNRAPRWAGLVCSVKAGRGAGVRAVGESINETSITERTVP